MAAAADVNSWYNSMVLTLHRRVSHGPEFTLNYALAKATDGGQVPGQFGTIQWNGLGARPAESQARVCALRIWISAIAL